MSGGPACPPCRFAPGEEAEVPFRAFAVSQPGNPTLIPIPFSLRAKGERLPGGYLLSFGKWSHIRETKTARHPAGPRTATRLKAVFPRYSVRTTWPCVVNRGPFFSFLSASGSIPVLFGPVKHRSGANARPDAALNNSIVIGRGEQAGRGRRSSPRQHDAGAQPGMGRAGRGYS